MSPRRALVAPHIPIVCPVCDGEAHIRGRIDQRTSYSVYCPDLRCRDLRMKRIEAIQLEIAAQRRGRTCSKCEKTAVTRGMCSTHYNQVWRQEWSAPKGPQRMPDDLDPTLGPKKWRD